MRQLSGIEQALTLTHTIYPLTAVCVLKIAQAPPAANIRRALDQIQASQPFLRASIVPDAGIFRFVPLEPRTEIPLQIAARTTGTSWIEWAESEINNGSVTGAGPLIRVIYVTGQAEGGEAEILLSFHHAVVDHESITHVAATLLREAGTADGETSSQRRVFPLSPLLEDRLPSSVKGLHRLLRLFGFVFRQAKDEIRYRRELYRHPDRPIPESSSNKILTISFNSSTTAQLVRWARDNRVTLNSMIGAALLSAVHRKRYDGRDKRMRLVLFAGLRPYLRPPVPPEEMGCMVSMMRFTVPVAGDMRLPELARHLNSAVEQSIRRGEHFLSALLSKFLIRQTIRKQDSRLGHAALSFAGALKLNGQYGSIRLLGVHAFITNNRLGPEFTSFGKIFGGELSMDFNFLTSEMTPHEAEILAKEFRETLEALIPLE